MKKDELNLASTAYIPPNTRFVIEASPGDDIWIPYQADADGTIITPWQSSEKTARSLIEHYRREKPNYSFRIVPAADWKASAIVGDRRNRQALGVDNESLMRDICQLLPIIQNVARAMALGDWDTFKAGIDALTIEEIEKGFDAFQRRNAPNLHSVHPVSIIEYACSHSPSYLRYLLDKGIPLPEDVMICSFALGCPEPIESIKALIDAGADINATNERGVDGLTAHLYSKTTRTCPDKLGELIELGLSIGTNPAGTSPLVGAVAKSNFEWTKALLDAGAEMTDHPGTKYPVSLLTLAIQTTAPILRLLLEAGADPDTIDHDNIHTVLIAVIFDRPDMIPILAEFGADIDADVGGRIAIEHAVNKGSKKVIKALIDAGSNIKGEPGTKALMRAVKLDRLPIAAILLEAGANPNLAPIGAPENVTEFAAEQGSPEMIRLLAHFGARLTRRSSTTNNGLIGIAADNDNPATARALIRLGADARSTGSEGMTPMHVACARFVKGASENLIADLLKANSQDINQRDDHGHTPLGYLANHGKAATKSANLIRKAGGVAI